MTVIGRHIRHNWPEWVDWSEQKTVMSMCGKRTTPRMSGIPAVTDQPVVIDEAGRLKWGWCDRCVSVTWRYLLPEGLDKSRAPEAIIQLHTQARKLLAPQRYYDARATARSRPGTGVERISLLRMKQLEEEYPDIDFQNLSTLV